MATNGTALAFRSQAPLMEDEPFASYAALGERIRRYAKLTLDEEKNHDLFETLVINLRRRRRMKGVRYVDVPELETFDELWEAATCSYNGFETALTIPIDWLDALLAALDSIAKSGFLADHTKIATDSVERGYSNFIWYEPGIVGNRLWRVTGWAGVLRQLDVMHARLYVRNVLATRQDEQWLAFDGEWLNDFLASVLEVRLAEAGAWLLTLPGIPLPESLTRMSPTDNDRTTARSYALEPRMAILCRPHRTVLLAGEEHIQLVGTDEALAVLRPRLCQVALQHFN